MQTVELHDIGQQVRTQDNRCTADPIFVVQGLKRIGPIMPEYSVDRLMYHDWQETETYYHDKPDPEKWAELDRLNKDGRLPSGVTAGGYIELWEDVQWCFTELGCKQYLEKDGHNVRRVYDDVRIYAKCLRRNSEMISIRNFLADQQA